MKRVKPDLRTALGRTVALVGLAVIPAAALGAMFVVGLTSDSLVADFHHELYPQSELMTSGQQPVSGTELEPDSRRRTSSGLPWPPTSSRP